MATNIQIGIDPTSAQQGRATVVKALDDIRNTTAQTKAEVIDFASRAKSSWKDVESAAEHYRQQTKKTTDDLWSQIEAEAAAISEKTKLARASRDAAAAQKEQEEVSRRLTSGLFGISSASIGAAAAMAGVGTALKYVISNSIENQESTANLDAAYKQFGDRAKVTREELSAYQSTVASTTALSTNEVSAMQTTLLRFGQVSGDMFRQAQQAAVDLSATLGISLASAALKVGEALESPDKAFLSLRAAGVSFTDAERKAIAAMVDLGLQAEAQTIVMNKLTESVNGAAAAKVDTFTGAWTRLKNELSDSSAVEGAAKAATFFVQRVTEGIFPATQSLQSLQAQMERLQKFEDQDVAKGHKGSEYRRQQIKDLEDLIRLKKESNAVSTPKGEDVAGADSVIMSVIAPTLAKREASLKAAAETAKRARAERNKGLDEFDTKALEAYSRQYAYQLQLEADRQKIRMDAAADKKSNNTDLQEIDTNKIQAMYKTAPVYLTAFEKYAKKTFQEVEDASNNTWGSLADGIANAAASGKLDIRSLAGTIISELIRVQVRAIMVRAILALFGGGTGGSASSAFAAGGVDAAVPAVSSAGAAFAAQGGNFSAGDWVVTGEKGPELQKMDRGAQIVNGNETRRLLSNIDSAQRQRGSGTTSGKQSDTPSQSVMQVNIVNHNDFSNATPEMASHLDAQMERSRVQTLSDVQRAYERTNNKALRYTH